MASAKCSQRRNSTGSKSLLSGHAKTNSALVSETVFEKSLNENQTSFVPVKKLENCIKRVLRRSESIPRVILVKK